MTKWQAFLRSTYKNVIVKRKYRAFMALLFDPSYRRDLNKLHELTKYTTNKEMRAINADSLVPGHRIVYPIYALGLFSVAKDLPPIRVVFDAVQGKYVVIDGNHRLPALVAWARTTDSKSLTCEVIW
jgi:hypothetical protein